MKILNKLVLAVGCVITLISCKEDSDNNSVSYVDFFTHAADNMALPALNAYQGNLNDLKSSITDFTSNPNLVNLADLQDQFRSNYIAWESVEVFQFGPAVDAEVLLKQGFNAFPASVSQINSNIDAGTYNLESAANINAAGLPALDYLLFGIGADATEILNKYTSDAKATNRKQYLNDLIDLLDSKLSLCISKWPEQRDAFIANSGTGNNSSLTVVFNSYLSHYESIKRDRFALPAGYATSFTIPIPKDPMACEGYYSGISHVLFQESIASSKDFFKGKGNNGSVDIGFYHKLQEYNAQSTIVDGALESAISDQYDILENMAALYTSPIEEQIVADSDAMAPFKSELQKMVPMIKSDMKSYLSVPITSQDADGD